MSELSELLVKGFKTLRVFQNESRTEFRTTISCEKEADIWLKEFSKKTLTQWIVMQTCSAPQRYTYNKHYICAFSNKNKTLPETQSKRNHNCEAHLKIRIKLLTKDTMKKDKFLKESSPLLGHVILRGKHNHHSDCASISNYFRSGEELRETFENYFHNGMTPAQAIRYHETMLLTREDGPKLIANGHYMPLMQTIYYWNREWKILNYGPLNAPLDTLETKIELYAKEGVTVKVRKESPWCVLVVTPVMKRAQSLFSAKAITFIDTTASCDSTSVNVTILSTGTKAGAVPLGILLHEAQTTESYTVAFSMFTETCPQGFGGQDHPEVFMTDNSTAEKTSLHTVCPESSQVLCDFHVGQAEWRWLHEHADSEDRRVLMLAFQKIQQSVNATQLEEAICSLKNISQSYYEMRVEGLLETKEEWVRLFRADLPTMGNNTNNYSEVTVRILKDIILNRLKSLNVCALVDCFVDGWDPYLQTKLGHYAYKRISKPQLLYNDLLKRMPPEFAKKIVKMDENLFMVPNSKDGVPTYEVDVKAGTCMCYSGTSGAFCKHQALVHEEYGCLFPNQPLINSADRFLLGQLAFGARCPEKSFFLEPKESLEDLERDLQELMELYDQHPGWSKPQHDLNLDEEMHTEGTSTSLDLENEANESENENGQELLQEFTEAWGNLYKLGTQSKKAGFHKFLKRATSALKAVSSENKAFEAMMKISAVLKRNVSKGRSGVRIKTQPTSQARRRPGLTRGSARMPAGRPSKKVPTRPPKRKRRLAESVKANRPHVKKH